MEVKDILSFLSIEAGSIDDLKAKFSKDYIARNKVFTDEEIRKQMMTDQGQRWGKFETSMKSSLRELGVEKLEGEKAEDLFTNGITALKTRIETLQNEATKGADEKVRTLQSNVEALNAKYESERARAESANKLLKEKDGKITELETGFTTFKQGIQIDQHLNSVLKEIKFVDDFHTDPVKKAGFEHMFSQSFKKALDDKGNLQLLKADGTQITNESGNQFLTPKDIIEDFAKKLNLLKLNNQNKSANFQPPKPPASSSNGHENGGEDVNRAGFRKRSLT